MHLSGTIFCGRLIHIRCSSEYLGQQNGMCGDESKYTTLCVHGNEGTFHQGQQCGALLRAKGVLS